MLIPHTKAMIMKNPPHPGEILKYDYMEPLNLTVSSLAKAIHVSRKNLSQIVNKSAGISPSMAVRLSKAFQTSPMYWLGMQEEYELSKVLNSDLVNEDIKPLVVVT